MIRGQVREGETATPTETPDWISQDPDTKVVGGLETETNTPVTPRRSEKSCIYIVEHDKYYIYIWIMRGDAKIYNNGLDE